MTIQTIESILPPIVMERLVETARATPDLQMLMLYGSRSRGDSHADSDWDFAYLAGAEFDVAAFLGRLVELIGTDRIDMVDLRRAGGLLRYRAARDGHVIFEGQPRLAEQFRLDAASFWCDVSPVLEGGYKEILKELEL